MKSFYSMDAIKKAIKEKQEEIKDVDEQQAMSIFLLRSKEDKPKETDEEKKKRIGIPDQDINELLK